MHRCPASGALAKRAWLHPVSVELFGGADPARRRLATRRDLRDWTMVRAWTRNVLTSALAIGAPGVSAGRSGPGVGRAGWIGGRADGGGRGRS